jgi:putative PIN family toxin of toxin-antitoxin system
VKVLLDSSVLIAAYISRAGVCSQLLEDVLMEHERVTCELILNEVTRTLAEKFHFPAETIARVKQSIVNAATCVSPVELPLDSCRDPSDIPVLGAAVAGEVKMLITVDKDLLVLRTSCGIAVSKPGEFWQRDS